jgi:hypothetical protein
MPALAPFRRAPRTHVRLERLDDLILPSVARLLAIGADAGGLPVVQLIDPATDQEKSSIVAYDPAFRGGVRVALGDLNGDGVPEIVTGAGPGGGPHVKVFDGRTGDTLASLFAYDPAFRGGISVAVGDVDGDGQADIVTAPGIGGGPDVRVFDASGNLKSGFLAYDAAFRGGVSVAIGDVNGDFKAEIITGAGPGGGPHVEVFTGDGTRLTSFQAYDPAFRGGVSVAAADLTGDGVAEIITGAGPGGGPHVQVFGGAGDLRTSFLAGDSTLRTGTRVAATDADGNGRTDIVTAFGNAWRAFDAVTLQFIASGVEGPTFQGRSDFDGISVAGPQQQAIDPARADSVIQWNRITLDAIRTTNTPPPKSSRDLAMVSAAVYNAVNAVVPLHEFYHVNPESAPNASAFAAAAAAAHKVLVALFPSLTSTFDSAFHSSVPTEEAAVMEGVQVGERMADQILSWRTNDNSSLVIPYTPGTTTGQWKPTPPAFAPALLPNWPLVTPFAMTGGTEFRPAGPPLMSSEAYADAVNQVKSLGSANSTVRTADQTQVALFWADGGNTVTPPGHWNLIAQTVSLTRGLSLVQNARLFALLNFAEADCAIAAWDAKFADNTWRPITAIQNADLDNNPATTADKTWTPLLVTPPFPTYTSGHSTFSGGAATVLSDLIGTNVPFTSRRHVSQPYTRSFANFQQAADEAGMSRIYGGIHFMFDNVDGLACGRQIGNLVATQFLT